MFSQNEAEWYDTLYHDKDYDSDLDAFVRRMDPWTQGAFLAVDVGAGTGNTTLALRRRFDLAMVHSVDPSPYMRREAARKGVHVSDGSLGNYSGTWAGSVDLVLAMFNVVGYASVDIEQFREALKRVALSLSKRGVFMFDFILASEAASNLRAKEQKIVRKDGWTLERITEKRFDSLGGILQYDMRYKASGPDGTVTTWRNTHLVRCFSPLELRLLLESAGLRADFYPPGDGPAVPGFYMICKAMRDDR